QLDMAVAFEIRDKEKLEQLLVAQVDRNSPSYHQWLTPEEFGERFGPEMSKYNAALDWLKSQGFVIDHTWPNRLRIHFHGTAETAEKAFNVNIDNYSLNSELHYAHSQDPTVSEGLGIEAVFGLEDFTQFMPMPHTLRRPEPNAIIGNSSFHLGPQDLATIYDINPMYAGGFNGAAQSVPILSP